MPAQRRPDSGSGEPPTSARALADFLRSRRRRLGPADVGLPAGARRRIPGLRREEVALLAGISPTYYTFLEQGRDVHPSRQVLDALGRALRLGAAEVAHLHEIAHGGPPPSAAPAVAETLAPSVAALVHRLDPFPTYVTGRRFDVLAANRAARLLWTDWPALPEPERNMLWWTFTAPSARETFAEWEVEAKALLARFRAAADTHPDDPGYEALARRLREASPQARVWWRQHDIAPLSSGVKRLRHPVLGEFELTHVVLQVADDPGQKVVTFAAEGSCQALIAELVGAMA